MSILKPNFVNLAEQELSNPVLPPNIADLSKETVYTKPLPGCELLKAASSFATEKKPVLCKKTYTGSPPDEEFSEMVKISSEEDIPEYVFMPGSQITIGGDIYASYKKIGNIVTVLTGTAVEVGDYVVTGALGNVMKLTQAMAGSGRIILGKAVTAASPEPLSTAPIQVEVGVYPMGSLVFGGGET
jgi:hypothetical protein